MGDLINSGVIALIVLGFIMTVMMINRIRTSKNKAIRTAILEKKLIADELHRSKIELEAFTKLLSEKNELIETFKVSGDNLHLNNGVEEDRYAILNQLAQVTILSEEEWILFRNLFDKAYPGFFIRLREKIPDVSPADMRLIALTKLRLSQKEMAAMLGIGYDAIRKARQRLRSKGNIEKEGSLEKLAAMI